MEKEQKFNAPEIQKNLESELQKKGYHIKKARLPEGEPIQCEKCMKENCFEFHGEGWFVEGEFYCEKHKTDALSVLKQIDEGADRMRKEQEEIIKTRRKRLITYAD